MSGKIEIIICDDQEFDHDLVEMYRQYDYNLKYPAWLEWKYRKNPYGDPILVIARSGSTIAGMQAYLPRDYYSSKRLVKTVEAVDAFVTPSFRRGGIYQQIWAESKPVIKERGLVLMTFPSVKSQSIGAMRKEGFSTVGGLNTYIKVLRPAALLKERNLNAFGWIYEKLFEPFGRVRRSRSRAAIEMREIYRFERDFQANQRATAGERSREYLNWKFCECPMHDYKCILFSESGEQIGFAVLRFGSEKFVLSIHDCVVFRHSFSCVESLIRYVWDKYPDIGVISVTELEGGPLFPALKKLGFFRTNSNQVLMLDNFQGSVVSLNPREWLITRGDSDW
ncbi:MAG: hypothetical protein ACU843_11795 [Gammaproteobacteria bacterium]